METLEQTDLRADARNERLAFGAHVFLPVAVGIIATRYGIEFNDTSAIRQIRQGVLDAIVIRAEPVISITLNASAA